MSVSLVLQDSAGKDIYVTSKQSENKMRFLVPANTKIEKVRVDSAKGILDSAKLICGGSTVVAAPETAEDVKKLLQIVGIMNVEVILLDGIASAAYPPFWGQLDAGHEQFGSVEESLRTEIPTPKTQVSKRVFDSSTRDGFFEARRRVEEGAGRDPEEAPILSESE